MRYLCKDHETTEFRGICDDCKKFHYTSEDHVVDFFAYLLENKVRYERFQEVIISQKSSQRRVFTKTLKLLKLKFQI